MQNKFMSLTVLTILCFTAGQAYADSLAWIPLTPEQKNEISVFNIKVYKETDHGCFIHLDHAIGEILRENGYAYEIVDPNLHPGNYFLVFKVGRGINAYPGSLLWEGERIYLVRMNESDAMLAKAAGYESARLPFLPHSLRATKHELMTIPAVDTIIQRLVSEVSEDSIRQTILDLQNFNTRYTYTWNCDSAASYLFQRFTDLGLDVEYDIYVLNGDVSYNVCATYPGQVHPESIVIASGHFDSYSDNAYVLAPGADDDASGVAAALEIARVLAQADFRWTVKYLAFSGEEQWMKGSYHWVDSVAVPQNLLIEGVYNLDMIGYAAYDTSLMYVTPNIPSQMLAVLAETVNADYGIGLNVANYLDVDAYGDHTPFWEQGYKAVFVIEDSEWGIWYGSNPHYHTTHDTLGTLTMSLVHRTAKLALACLATLAGPIHGPGIGERYTKSNKAEIHGLSIAPNPMRQSCLFTLPWQPDINSNLIIYDALGRKVRTLAVTGFSQEWNGLDDSGHHVKNGVYFARLFNREKQVTTKFVILE